MERVGADGDVDGFLAERSERTVVGTVDQVRARLAEYEDAGVERIFLQHLVHTDLDAVALIGSL
jgi:alkanesulfonate monooxygenase SsuD/methylene tetrahydromethanopterin reductase-like flavin-dependent oxidoreductase (luciferase family)